MKGESDGLLLLPSDKALIDDPAFRPFVEIYAKVPIRHLFQKNGVIYNYDIKVTPSGIKRKYTLSYLIYVILM